MKFDWTDAIRTACEWGAEHPLKLVVRAMDQINVPKRGLSMASPTDWHAYSGSLLDRCLFVAFCQFPLGRLKLDLRRRGLRKGAEALP